ncbi:MAG: PqqD family peptide modification chaperone [Treponema sp.]|nr:PqqD family peptide modification chaperone [Treponema sp.]
MTKKSPNYLDIVFIHNAAIKFEEADDGAITLFVENRGFFNFLAQKLLGKPRISQIHLEEFGNFIWKEIDGKQTLSDVSQKVHEKFGEKAEPLLPRLIQYFKILENNGFVTRKKDY